MLIVSYYTPPYVKHTERLQASREFKEKKRA